MSFINFRGDNVFVGIKEKETVECAKCSHLVYKTTAKIKKFQGDTFYCPGCEPGWDVKYWWEKYDSLGKYIGGEYRYCKNMVPCDESGKIIKKDTYK